jgi:hypothetical protein
MGFAPPVLANGESVLGAAPARVTGAGVDKMIDHVQAFCDVFLGVYNANSTGAVKAQVLPTQLGTATAVCTTPVVCVAPPLFPLHVGQVAAFVVGPLPLLQKLLSAAERRRFLHTVGAKLGLRPGDVLVVGHGYLGGLEATGIGLRVSPSRVPSVGLSCHLCASRRVALCLAALATVDGHVWWH